MARSCTPTRLHALPHPRDAMHITQVTLKNCALGDNAGKILGIMFSTNNTVEEIDLSENPVPSTVCNVTCSAAPLSHPARLARILR